MVTCHLNGVKIQMLLDSRAQVSIVGKSWVEQVLSDVNIQPIESLLSIRQFEVTAANGTIIPFDGWITVLLEI